MATVMAVLRGLLTAAVVTVVWLVLCRKPPARAPVTGIAESRSTGIVAEQARRDLVAPMAVLFAIIGSAAIYAGAQFIPPGYPVSEADLRDRFRDGEVGLLLSDDTVEAELEVDMLDYGGTTAVSTRLLLFLHSETNRTVEWVLILNGTARYVDPLGQHRKGSDSDFYAGDATVRLHEGTQVFEGTARIGPDAVTERAADMSGANVGPFFYRSGSPPEYGSKTIAHLPAYYTGGFPAWMRDEVEERGLGSPREFNVFVNVALWALPDLVRVDFASQPVRQDSGVLLVDGLGGLSDVTIAYTDLAIEASEASSEVVAGVMLGFGGSAILAALSLPLQRWTVRRPTWRESAQKTKRARP